MLIVNINMDNYEININYLPNELQVEIINNLSLEELRRVFMSIEDLNVRAYTRMRGEKLSLWLNTPSYELAKAGDLEGLEWLAEQGVDISHEYVINNAANSGNLELVKWLADQGADISDIWVIRFAADSGNLELVKWLEDRIRIVS